MLGINAGLGLVLLNGDQMPRCVFPKIEVEIITPQLWESWSKMDLCQEISQKQQMCYFPKSKLKTAAQRHLWNKCWVRWIFTPSENCSEKRRLKMSQQHAFHFNSNKSRQECITSEYISDNTINKHLTFSFWSLASLYEDKLRGSTLVCLLEYFRQYFSTLGKQAQYNPESFPSLTVYETIRLRSEQPPIIEHEIQRWRL